MFGLFKKKQESLAIGAPVKGKTVDLHSVKDPTFGEEILGKGVAILPEDGNIFAPADGEISMIFDTGHAVSLVADTGCEILVHVGRAGSQGRPNRIFIYRPPLIISIPATIRRQLMF